MADPKFTPDQPFFSKATSQGVGREGKAVYLLIRECTVLNLEYQDVGTHWMRVFSEPQKRAECINTLSFAFSLPF